jgi:hypothetical protein
MYDVFGPGQQRHVPLDDDAVETVTKTRKARDMGLKPGYNLDKTWDLIEEIEGPDYK